MDFDPRDYDSRDDERFGPDRERGGRNGSHDYDRDDTRWGERDRDDRERDFDPREVFNITDEELRKALTGVWERRRLLKAVGESRPNADAPAVGE